MKITRHLFVVGTLLLAGCATYEQPPAAVRSSVYTTLQDEQKHLLPSGIDVLTLEEAQNIALKNNPSFKSKYFAIAAARASYYQKFSGYLPTVNASFSAGQQLGRMHDAGGWYNTNSFSFTPQISGSLLIFDSFRREMDLLAQKHNWQATEAAEDDARRLLVEAVANAYNGVLLAHAQMNIAKEDMKFNKDMLRDTRLKFDAGAVSLSEVLNFQIQYNQAESNLITAQYNYATNKYALAQLLGLTEGTIPETVKFPTKPAEDVDVLPDVSVYLDLALANRPDLKSLREQMEVSKYNYWASLAAFGPTFTANYAIGYSDSHSHSCRTATEDGPTFTHTHGGTFSYGLNVNWNLFNGGNDYFAARAAQAQMVQADYNMAQTWIQVIVDVRIAYDNYITTVKQMKLFQKTFELTKKTRDLVAEEYKAGSTELTRMNEAQRDQVNAESNYVSAIIRMANARAQLAAAANLR
ncbi:MAG: TolC family protein [Lentisphaeria bacterium]|nr:TolC family protein [Lentisphaeria bacterium]